ncbi:ImmA/IrrE family metallo-endopeptidase [Bradyrhizobium sp. DASA03005]|uniref:ImmA/IrrE family metallo-endopeptidase n=1 Tax=unclassified Bradyrhizobium TaxID=2631580 RepID=UPI003F72E18A
MPYEAFLTTALGAVRLERLQRRFGTSLEQVCHRLSTLQRRNSPGIPLYFFEDRHRRKCPEA